DTGLTMHFLLEALAVRHPKTLKVAALLDKPARRRLEVPVDYKGFTIEDRFVIGYGLDLEGRYRNLPYIAALKGSVQARLRATPLSRTRRASSDRCSRTCCATSSIAGA